MATYRTKVIDAIVNPNVLPGFTMIAGKITLDNTKTATITFPARGVFLAIGTLGTAAVAGEVTITNNSASVVFTAGADGTLNYFIIASVTEEFTVPDAGTSDVVVTPSA